MGINTHFNRKGPHVAHWDPQKYIPMVAGLGLGWIRDEIAWEKVELSPGKYAIPEHALEWIDLANRHGLKINLIFSEVNNHSYPGRGYDRDAYAKAAAWTARALAGKIHAMQILNEPFRYYASTYNQGVIVGGLWYGREKDGTVSSYIGTYHGFMNHAADAIKAANPDIKVVGGLTAPLHAHLQLRLGLPFSPNLDATTLHLYSYKNTPEILPYPASPSAHARDGFDVSDKTGSFTSLIATYRQALTRHHAPGKIWITEWGYTTYREGKGRKVNYDGFSEAAQAKYIQRRFLQSLALDIDVNFVFTLLDNVSPGKGWDPLESEDNFGVVRIDGTQKPAYAAIQRVARATLGFVNRPMLAVKATPFSSRPDRNPTSWNNTLVHALDGIAAYTFTDPTGVPVVALWSMERVSDLSPRTADIEINLATIPTATLPIVTVHDLMTDQTYTPETEVDPQDSGRLRLPRLAVPDHPILVRLAPSAVQTK